MGHILKRAKNIKNIQVVLRYEESFESYIFHVHLLSGFWEDTFQECDITTYVLKRSYIYNGFVFYLRFVLKGWYKQTTEIALGAF